MKQTLQFRILSLQVIKRSLVVLCLALLANLTNTHAQTINLPLIQDAFRNDAFTSGVAVPTPTMTNIYLSEDFSTVTNYVGTSIYPGNENLAQAALKFMLPPSGSVLSRAKLFFKVMDIQGSPTATVTLTDDNNWMQTTDEATSKFPTLSNASTLLTDAPVSSDGWVSLNLATSDLDTKIVSSGTTDVTMIITGSTVPHTYFNFVADDDASGNKAYLRLTFKPQVQSVSVPSNNTYKIGDALNFVVSFDSLINVTGTPKLPITLNTGGTVQASYLTGSGSQNLVFRYTVASGDLDMDGVTVGSAIALNGGTIISDFGNDAELNLYYVGTTTGVRVNGILPAISSVSPTSGPIAGGTSVTITGTGFTGATAVKFASTNATSFAVNSATQITAVSPAGSAGATDITITTPNGTSTTNINDKFTYVAAPTATTNAATSITSTAATLNGSINAKNASTTVTFEYGLTTSYGTIVTADQSPVTGGTATPVSKAITGLAAGTTYHYRVVGVNSGGTTNGTDLTFTTVATVPTESFYDQITLPFAPTDDVDMSSSTLAPSMYLASASTSKSYPSKGYKVTLPKSGTITLSASSNEIATNEFAFLVSTSYDASLSSKKYMAAGNGTTTTITPGAYYIVLFTDNKYGKFRVNITFKALPNITSISPANGPIVGGTSVVITGINFTGTTAVKFGTTAATSFTVNSDTQITAVSPSRAAGTVDITVTTAGGTTATGSADQFMYVDTPTATTNAATSITSSGATLNGGINAKNASTTVTFEYGLTTSYGTTVTVDQSPVTGSTTTLVSKAITGLTAGTTYHYRVVGVNTNETTTGDDMTFTTLKLPSVTTQAVSSISTNSVVANGNITDLGQPNPTAYGFCWSTSQNPTTDNSKIDKGSISNIGAFSATLTGLGTHTKYYVRAYSINEAGTSYGEQVSFSTKGIIANVILYEIKDIESTSAIGKCSITDFGFPNATAYGICWSTSPNPTMFNSKIHNLGTPTSIGFFYASLTELEPNTVYYARVYAANAEGIAYSDEISFQTTQSNPVITWSNPSDISYGTALNDLQLNATSNVEGTFEYTPAAGAKLNVGDAQELSVTFTPKDLTKNKIVNKTVQINVRKAVPVITWENPKDIVSGTALSDLQLNAVANTEGTFVYNPIAGTVLNTGDLQELTVLFSPADTEHYSAISYTVKINVVIKTGIDPEKQNSISIYPNPTTDKFYIIGIEDQTTIRISSLNGKLISEKKVANHEAISVQNLPAGTYLIGITNKEAMTYYKLVKK